MYKNKMFKFMIKSFLLVILLVFEYFTKTANCIEVRVKDLDVGGAAAFRTIRSNIEDIYRITYNSSNTTLNVTAWTNATTEIPLLIVIRQEKGLISLQLPNKDTQQAGAAVVQNVSRILCPAYVGRHDSNGLSTVYIDIYTSSPTNIAYSLKVEYFQSFILNEHSNTNSVFVSPFAPVFFKYDLRHESSIVKFTSEDRICTTVSVQRMMCPVFDLKHTIDFEGQYQTMTKLAAISVDNPDLRHKSMYVVISVHPTDKDCCDSANCSGAAYHRIKKIKIDVIPGYDHSKVNLNYALTLSIFLGIYLFICPFLCLIEPYSEKSFKNLIDEAKMSETNFTASTAVTPTSSNKVFACTNENPKQQKLEHKFHSTSSNNKSSVIKSLSLRNHKNVNNFLNKLLIIKRLNENNNINNNNLSSASTLSNRKSKINNQLNQDRLIVIDHSLDSNNHAKMGEVIMPVVLESLPEEEAQMINDHQNRCANDDIEIPSQHNLETGTFLKDGEKIPDEIYLETTTAHQSECPNNLTIAIPVVLSKDGLREMLNEDENQSSMEIVVNQHNISNTSSNQNNNNNTNISSSKGNCHSSTTNSDFLMAYRELFKNKSTLRVHDLARKQPKLVDRKIMNYPRLIMAIATFYVLPVIQLVLLHQTVN
jgi:hypothetical protein